MRIHSAKKRLQYIFPVSVIASTYYFLLYASTLVYCRVIKIEKRYETATFSRFPSQLSERNETIIGRISSDTIVLYVLRIFSDLLRIMRLARQRTSWKAVKCLLSSIRNKDSKVSIRRQSRVFAFYASDRRYVYAVGRIRDGTKRGA